MKFLLGLFILTQGLYAHDDCPPPMAPSLPEELTRVAQTIVDVNRDNNKCPNNSYPDEFGGATTLEELKTQVNNRLQSMGLTAVWEAGSTTHSNWQSFQAEDLSRAKQLAKVTVAALSQYPPEFFRKAGLSKVQLIKDLRVTEQARMALPDPRNDLLVFADNNEPALNNCLEEIEMRMHHEFFHLMEGTLHNNQMRPNIRSWNRLNPESFRYGGGGQEAYEGQANFAELERPQDGFSTGYSTFGAEEDRSEIFAYMMTRGFRERQNGWISVDPILATKVNYLKRFLREEFDVTDEFFGGSSSRPAPREAEAVSRAP